MEPLNKRERGFKRCTAPPVKKPCAVAARKGRIDATVRLKIRRLVELGMLEARRRNTAKGDPDTNERATGGHIMGGWFHAAPFSHP